MRKLQIIILICLIGACTSCGYIGQKRVRGNGQLKTETMTVQSFERLEVSGAADVVLKQDAAVSVKVEGDENLLPYIEVFNEGNTLLVKTKRGYNLRPKRKLVVYISSPVYKKIQVSGAGEIRSENLLSSKEKFSFGLSGAGDIRLSLDAPEVAINVSGAGSIKLEGKTRNLDLGVSGAGDVNCFDLLTENTNVSISGAGDADIYASVKLTGHVSGAGDIRYKGGAVSEIRTSGAGGVKKMD